MSKIEKEIKSYFEDVLKHDDQYESIVKKADLQKTQKKEKKEIFDFIFGELIMLFEEKNARRTHSCGCLVLIILVVLINTLTRC